VFSLSALKILCSLILCSECYTKGLERGSRKKPPRQLFVVIHSVNEDELARAHTGCICSKTAKIW